MLVSTTTSEPSQPSRTRDALEANKLRITLGDAWMMRGRGGGPSVGSDALVSTTSESPTIAYLTHAILLRRSKLRITSGVVRSVVPCCEGAMPSLCGGAAADRQHRTCNAHHGLRKLAMNWFQPPLNFRTVNHRILLHTL